MKNRYIIITSAYNEDKNIRYCLESVVKQTILPQEWIIVNDGSTDTTRQIIEEFIVNYPWIKLVNKNKIQVEFGAHAVANFNYALNKICTVDFDYVAQLDADISIDRADFFEYQLHKFDCMPRLGISSGITYQIHNNNKMLTKRKYWRTGGATKLYRKECLADIGGLKPIFSWDGLDVYQAMYHNWKSRTFFKLLVNHMGKNRMSDRSKQKSLFFIKGKSAYIRGYPIEFIILKFFAYIVTKPALGISFIRGYRYAVRSKIKRYVTREEAAFIRKIQYLRILDSFTKKELL